MMTTMQPIKDARNRRVSRTVRVRSVSLERARQEAVERLIALLEADSLERPRVRLSADSGVDRLNWLARLRMARANYVLQTCGDWKRVGTGAWERTDA